MLPIYCTKCGRKLIRKTEQKKIGVQYGALSGTRHDIISTNEFLTCPRRNRITRYFTGHDRFIIYFEHAHPVYVGDTGW